MVDFHLVRSTFPFVVLFLQTLNLLKLTSKGDVDALESDVERDVSDDAVSDL